MGREDIHVALGVLSSSDLVALIEQQARDNDRLIPAEEPVERRYSGLEGGYASQGINPNTDYRGRGHR